MDIKIKFVYLKYGIIMKLNLYKFILIKLHFLKVIILNHKTIQISNLLLIVILYIILFKRLYLF